MNPRLLLVRNGLNGAAPWLAHALQEAGLNVAKSVLLDRDTRAVYDQARAVRTPHDRVAAAAARPPTDGVTVTFSAVS